uniref:Diamine acetyltransferase 1 n=1 Tax=Loxodonta africana TaxID=9785 RepID=G3UII5_LOXAF
VWPRTKDPCIGKLVYPEDFFDYRGFGTGSEILKILSQVAVKCQCSRVHLLVAECKEPSNTFYKRRGASDLFREEGWRPLEMTSNVAKIGSRG